METYLDVKLVVDCTKHAIRYGFVLTYEDDTFVLRHNNNNLVVAYNNITCIDGFFAGYMFNSEHTKGIDWAEKE